MSGGIGRQVELEVRRSMGVRYGLNGGGEHVFVGNRREADTVLPVCIIRFLGILAGPFCQTLTHLVPHAPQEGLHLSHQLVVKEVVVQPVGAQQHDVALLEGEADGRGVEVGSEEAERKIRGSR